MRHLTFHPIIAAIICGTALAHTNYAQLLEKKVTIHLEEIPFEVALKEVETLTHVRFFYSIDQLYVSGKITITATNTPLGDLLNQLFSPHHIRYKVHERESTITLKRRRHPHHQEMTKPKPDDHHNERTDAVVRNGIVKDASTGRPIAGVNIVIKGSSMGTTTDSDGAFTLEAKYRDILIFSFIGYTTVQVSITNQRTIEVLLAEDIKSLDEVEINAGYYKTTKVFQTGNISRIDGTVIRNQPVSNPLAAMQGNVAGLEVTQLTGVQGGNFTVRIRGQNSIANGNDPLYVVDGVPFTSTPMSSSLTSQNIYVDGTSPLNNISPGDIESIEVLKDADATAIYGSRGSNGVVLITTKKGKPGRVKADFNHYSGIGMVTRNIRLLDTEQYLTMRHEAFRNDGQIPTVSNAPDLTTWDQNRYTDWQKELLGGTARYHDASLSVSGGSNQFRYITGAGYRKETTVFPGENDFQRVSGHLNLVNTSGNGRFKSSVTLNYTHTHTDLISRDLTVDAVSLPPNAPALYTADGEMNWDNATGYNQSLLHPLSYLKRRLDSQTNYFMTSATLGYELLPGLELFTSGGYTHVDTDAITKNPKSAYSPDLSQTLTNESVFASNKFRNWVLEPQLKWSGEWGNHQIDLLAGLSFLEQISTVLDRGGTGFPMESTMTDILAAPEVRIYADEYSRYRYHAQFGRVNYRFKSKYIINVTGRRDGSSRFGPGNQFAGFCAVGMAWLLAKEEYIKSALPFVSSGKLRASYGTTGNDQLGDYQYLDTYAPSSSYFGIPGLRPVRLNNPDFAWESNRKLEATLELGMWKDRIAFEFCYYRNRTSSQLVGFALPPTTGFTNILGNLPVTVQNSGVEIQIQADNIRKHTFTWSTSLNLSVPVNKLVDFPGLENSPAYANTLVVGEPLAVRKRYHYLGINPETGLYMVEDTNGDGAITVDDREIMPFVGTKFFGGISNTVTFNGFQLDILMQYVNQTGPNPIANWVIPPGHATNQPADVMNRWREEGDVAAVQKFTTSSAGTTALIRYQNSENSVSDASFLRVKNISVCYSFSPRFLKAMKLQLLRVFIQAQNLCTVTGDKGLDPETGSRSLPPLRTITGGIHVTL